MVIGLASGSLEKLLVTSTLTGGAVARDIVGIAEYITCCEEADVVHVL
jgi:hypothetical protein